MNTQRNTTEKQIFNRSIGRLMEWLEASNLDNLKNPIKTHIRTLQNDLKANNLLITEENSYEQRKD